MLILMTSCKKDESPPDISFMTNTGYITSNTTLTTGSGFTVGITASKHSEDCEDLTRLTVTRDNGATTAWDSLFTGSSVSRVFNFTAKPITGSEKFTFTVTDGNGNTAEVSFTVNTVSQAPSISFITDAGYTSSDATVVIGTDFTAGITASKNTNTNENLVRLLVTRDDGVTEVLDSTFSSGTVTRTFVFTAKNIVTTESFSFTIYDNNDKYASVSFTITTYDPYQMTETHTGTIYNALGANPAGWDLVSNNSLAYTSSNDDIKDMMNQTTVVTDNNNWVSGWEALNNTLYVETSASIYNNATTLNVPDAYSSGTPVSAITNAGIGKYYVAKLRGGNDYAVIKITDVYVTTVDLPYDDNNDYIEFEYKK